MNYSLLTLHGKLRSHNLHNLLWHRSITNYIKPSFFFTIYNSSYICTNVDNLSTISYSIIMPKNFHMHYEIAWCENFGLEVKKYFVWITVIKNRVWLQTNVKINSSNPLHGNSNDDLCYVCLLLVTWYI